MNTQQLYDTLGKKGGALDGYCSLLNLRGSNRGRTVNTRRSHAAAAEKESAGAIGEIYREKDAKY